MQSYFDKKLRRKSKQPETETATATKTEERSNSVTSPPAPTVHTPGEEPMASPVLDEEDEKFLERLAALTNEPEGTPPPLPDRPATVILDGGQKKTGKDAQEALMDGADKVPLPTSPPEITVTDGEKDGGVSRKKSVMGYFALAQQRFKSTLDKDKDSTKEKDKKDKGKQKVTDKDRAKTADTLMAAAQSAKSAEQAEKEKENKELTDILDDLNLSAVNNRVFSFSKESEELLNKFKLVLKDIVNGAPTAYDDLTKLFTDYEGQLKKMYGSMPPFLQNLVKSLPAKVTAALGPELMAAQAEKPGFDAKMKAGGSKSKSGFKRPKVPSLKNLITAEGAVATMLKSILNFLKLRFPVLMTGTNILLSLAVFILMFVFWYCHKRGRETRLEKEGLAAREAEEGFASDASYTDDGDSLLGEASSSKPRGGQKEEKAEPPLIIQDNAEAPAAVEDMPSVSHLPDPKAVPLPRTEGNTPALEEPLEVPKSK